MSDLVQRFVGSTDGLAFHEPVVIVYARELNALETKLSKLETELKAEIESRTRWAEAWKVAKIDLEKALGVISMLEHHWISPMEYYEAVVWARMSREDIAAELSATFDLSLETTRQIADWMSAAEEEA